MEKITKAQRKCIFMTMDYTAKDAERLMLANPFKVYEEMGVMSHSKYVGTIQLDKQIAKRLNESEIDRIRDICRSALKKYYNGAV